MKKIPILRARELAEKYDYDIVIITGINSDNSGTITTYGKTKLLCNISGKIGENIGKDVFNGCQVINMSNNVKSLVSKYKTKLINIFDGYHLDWLDVKSDVKQINISFRVWIHPCQYKFVINILNDDPIDVTVERLGSTNPSSELELKNACEQAHKFESNIKEMEKLEWL